MEDDNNLPEIEQLKQWLRDNRQALIDAGISAFEATFFALVDDRDHTYFG
jgi:hypothetical protein